MKKSLLVGVFLVLVAVLMPQAAAAQLGATVPNWSVPSGGSGSRHGMTTQSDIGGGTAMVSVTPCRIVDTRGPAGTYGGPALAIAPATRDFPLLGGPCAGLPGVVLAYSLNFTMVGATGAGDIRVFPTGGAVPTVSTLNYLAGQTVANAAIVPAGTGGSITVQADVHGGNLLIDINGYFIGNGFSAPLNNGEFVGWAGSFSSGGVIFGANSSNTGHPTAGVRGQIPSGVTANDAAGVLGESFATTGHVHGVMGTISSTTNDTAGVYGKDGTALATVNNVIGQAGTRGEGKNGVIGLSSSNITEFGGVVGLMLDGSGNLGAFGALGESFTNAVWGLGNLSISGTKSFVDPHPTDASKMIDYVALEGPEAGTYFRGTSEIVHGMAVIPVPDHFAMVSDEEGLTVQLTPVGSAAVMYVESEDLNQIVVRSSRDVKFHYQVNGIRKAFKDHQPITENTMFNPRSPSTRMSGALAEEQRRRLIANGTFNADGTANLETAKALGWTAAWEAKAKEVRPLTAAETRPQITE